jgi:TRAP-type mannitol/chloroaromatic compound transport system permease large subunit
VYKAAVPFIILQLAVIVAIMIFPDIATWLPSFMEK